MKKTLAAVAILGAFAGSAMADVTVYGRMDTGLRFTQTEQTGVADKDTFAMESGNATTSRIGIKGAEKIADGLTVGFVLEAKLTGDDGHVGTSVKEAVGNDKFFDRESRLYVATDYGTFSAGRMGILRSDANYSGFLAGMISVSGTGSSANGQGSGAFAKNDTRWDNVVTYQSPVMAGAQVWAQYAMGNANENKHSNDRMVGVGASYKAGAFQAGLVVDQLVRGHADVGADVEDQLTVTAGANYDFGVAKVYAGAQYFKDASEIGTETFAKVAGVSAKDVDGYGLVLSASVPALGGVFTPTTTYVDAKSDLNDADVKAYDFGVQYKYNLSKQTFVYAGVNFLKEEAEVAAVKTEKETLKVAAGVAHYF